MAEIRPNVDLSYLVKDSGILLQDFYSEIETATDFEDLVDKIEAAMETDAYLGVTRGGTSTNFEMETRIVEYDGRRVRSVGDFVVDSSTPQIETTLLVQSDTNLQRIFPMCDTTIDTATGAFSLRPRMGTPLPEDYMEDLCLIKPLTNGDIQIIALFRAINTASVTMTGADKSESEVAVTFTGNARDFKDMKYAPVDIMTWKRTP